MYSGKVLVISGGRCIKTGQNFKNLKNAETMIEKNKLDENMQDNLVNVIIKIIILL